MAPTPRALVACAADGAAVLAALWVVAGLPPVRRVPCCRRVGIAHAFWVPALLSALLGAVEQTRQGCDTSLNTCLSMLLWCCLCFMPCVMAMAFRGLDKRGCTEQKRGTWRLAISFTCTVGLLMALQVVFPALADVPVIGKYIARFADQIVGEETCISRGEHFMEWHFKLFKLEFLPSLKVFYFLTMVIMPFLMGAGCGPLAMCLVCYCMKIVLKLKEEEVAFAVALFAPIISCCGILVQALCPCCKCKCDCNCNCKTTCPATGVCAAQCKKTQEVTKPAAKAPEPKAKNVNQNAQKTEKQQAKPQQKPAQQKQTQQKPQQQAQTQKQAQQPQQPQQVKQVKQAQQPKQEKPQKQMKQEKKDKQEKQVQPQKQQPQPQPQPQSQTKAQVKPQEKPQTTEPKKQKQQPAKEPAKESAKKEEPKQQPKQQPKQAQQNPKPAAKEPAKEQPKKQAPQPEKKPANKQVKKEKKEKPAAAPEQKKQPAVEQKPAEAKPADSKKPKVEKQVEAKKQVDAKIQKAMPETKQVSRKGDEAANVDAIKKETRDKARAERERYEQKEAKAAKQPSQGKPRVLNQPAGKGMRK